MIRGAIFSSKKKQGSDGLIFLKDNARAGYDFTNIAGNEDDAHTSHLDLTSNGRNLTDNGGLNTPKIGFIQKSIGVIKSSLKCYTASGVKQAMITNSAATNIFINSFEVHLSFLLNDGQQGAGSFFLGTENGGNRRFDIQVYSTGAIGIRYAANAVGLSTWIASGNNIPDGFTGIIYMRIKMDFTDTLPLVEINGIRLTVSLFSGNTMATWIPANFISASALGVGGVWGGTFQADSAYKHILKLFVTNILTDLEAFHVSKYMTTL